MAANNGKREKQMPDINDLRRKRAELATAMQTAADSLASLEDAEAPNDTAIEAAQGDFDAAQAAFNRADAQVKRAEAAEQAAAQSAIAESQTGAQRGAVAPVAAQPKDPADRGVDVGLMFAALANTSGNVEQAAARLEADGHSGISASLSTTTQSAGGVLVPRAQSSELIQLLTPRITVRTMGVQVHDMPAGELRRARVSSGVTASYGTPGGRIGASAPTFDNIDQNFKTLGVLVPMDNALLGKTGSVSLGRVVRDLMVTEMALKSDIAFLRYDGTGDKPKGLRHWVPSGRWIVETEKTVAAVERTINRLEDMVTDSDVPGLALGWIMRASTKNFLASLRDLNSGQKIYPELERGELKGYPVKTTSQIPNNLGTGSDSEIYFGDFSEVMIGESQRVTLATSTEAAYIDGNGDVISAFQNNKTLMRAIAEHDLAPAHDVAIVGATVTGWNF